jgi:hypothetical protein
VIYATGFRVSWAIVYVAAKYGLPFIGAWTVIGWRRFRRSQNNEAANGWPSVEGVIVAGNVTPIPKTMLFLATITYSYFVEEYRAGKYLREFSKEADADEFVRGLKDRRLQIRYKPNKPDTSILDETSLSQLVAIPLRR